MRELINNEIGKRKNLARQLITVILGLYFVVAATATSIQLILEFQNEKNRLSKQIESLAHTFQASASKALWNYDEDQLSAALLGMSRNQEVIGVEIIGMTLPQRIGQIFDDQGARITIEPLTGKITAINAQGFYDRLYLQNFPLLSPDDGSKIGSIKLYSSSLTVIERTYTTIVLTILSAIVKTLALSLITFYIINRYVGKPLTKLKDQILAFDIESTEKTNEGTTAYDKSNTANEIDILNKSYQALCVKLIDKNKLVKDYTVNLENEVEQRTQKLNKALEELVNSNRVKADFIANISHELRTPLNSIIGFTRRICKKNRDALPTEIAEKLDIVLSNAEHLNELINDVLDVSKIESGNVKLKYRKLELNRLLDTLKEGYLPTLQEKQIEFNIFNNFGNSVTVDPLRFEQILRNLISNAVKFTKEGKIELHCRVEVRDQQKGILVEVHDTGRGIAEDDIAKLFQRFVQVGNQSINTIQGTGLGLAIIKELVILHGGEVSVKSTLGIGSVFSFWLPDFSEESLAISL